MLGVSTSYGYRRVGELPKLEQCSRGKEFRLRPREPYVGTVPATVLLERWIEKDELATDT
jgi:hypothetical protein